MKCKPYFMLSTACFITVCACTQDDPDTANKLADFPSTFFKRINRKLKVPEGQPAWQTGEQNLQKIPHAPTKVQLL